MLVCVCNHRGTGSRWTGPLGQRLLRPGKDENRVEYFQSGCCVCIDSVGNRNPDNCGLKNSENIRVFYRGRTVVNPNSLREAERSQSDINARRKRASNLQVKVQSLRFSYRVAVYG